MYGQKPLIEGATGRRRKKRRKRRKKGSDDEDWGADFIEQSKINVEDREEGIMYNILDEIVQPNDMVITMGAGDIWRHSDKYNEHLNNKLGK